MIQTCIGHCYYILLSYGLFFTFTYLLCVTLYGPQFNFILPTQTQSMVTPDQGMSQFDAHESDVEEVPHPAASPSECSGRSWSVVDSLPPTTIILELLIVFYVPIVSCKLCVDIKFSLLYATFL
jgi:hypothetical protein